MEEIKFNCTGCGLCCQKVGNVLANKDALMPGVRNLLEEFPYKALENGACEKFDVETKRCTVYDTRPDVCRVNRVYERVHSTYISREDYYKLSEGICKKMQIEHSDNTI